MTVDLPRSLEEPEWGGRFCAADAPQVDARLLGARGEDQNGDCDNHGHQPFVVETLLANRIASSNATSHLRRTLGTSDGGFRMVRGDSYHFDRVRQQRRLVGRRGRPFSPLH
jgi:hypothetical protein